MRLFVCAGANTVTLFLPVRVYVFSAKMENDDNTDEDEAKQEDVQEELSPSQKLKERFKDLWENPRELEACQ